MRPTQEARVKYFTDTLDKLLNKAVRFNLSGPLLAQFYEDDDGDYNIILTHRSMYDNYIEDMRKKIGDSFNVPEYDVRDLLENIDNSIVFPLFMISNKVIEPEKLNRLCRNSLLIFPKSAKYILNSVKKGEKIFEDVFIVKEQVNVNGIFEDVYSMQFITNNIAGLDTIFLNYTDSLDEILKIKMLPNEKMSLNYNPVISQLFETFNKGSDEEEIFGKLGINIKDLDSLLKNKDYMEIAHTLINGEEQFIHLYKDFIKGKTLKNKLFSVKTIEEDLYHIMNNFLYLEYNGIYQYLFYRELNNNFNGENDNNCIHWVIKEC